MNNPELTLLSEGQIWGNIEEPKLGVIRKYGTMAAATDLSVLTGNRLWEDWDDPAYNIDEDDSLAGIASAYWTKSADGDNDVLMVRMDGHRCRNYRCRSNCAVRPVLQSSVIYSQISSNRVRGYNGTDEVEYGEYPQMAADSRMQQILESGYLNGIKRTGRTYTFDSRKWDDYYSGFWGVTYDEYEYQGKKYIRVKANSAYNKFKLSNGIEYYDGDYVWVEVSPVKWLIDDKTETLVSKKCLVSGIRFNTDTYYGDFSKTEMKEYLDKYMSKDLFQSVVLTKHSDYVSENVDNKENPHGFELKDVTEEEILRGAIESNVAVFLHGLSSERKSVKVKQIDPNPEIIYSKNATSTSLEGISVRNKKTEEIMNIPPTWYKRIKRKCEAEPDKMHVVFFDGLTSANEDIQKTALDIIANRKVNGIWELPENARIVVSGKDLDSTLNEGLYSRFAHVTIDSKADSWLRESDNCNIHPAIYSYIAYKSFGEDALNTDCDDKEFDVSMEKWNMASKVLYTTNKPEMLRSLIGRVETAKFINFCNTRVIDVVDVLNNNYMGEDVERMSKAEIFNTVAKLSSVDEEHVGVIRKFVKRFGAEVCDIFDILWAHGDESRLNIISELKKDELNSSLDKINK